MKILLILPAFAGMLLFTSCGSISIGTGGDDNTSSSSSSSSSDDSWQATQQQINTQNMVNQINAASDQAAMNPIPQQ